MRTNDVVAQVSDRFDGLVLFTRTVFSPKHAARLDCHYAALGISKEPDGYEIEPLSNAMLGEAGGGCVSAARWWRSPMRRRSRRPWRNTARR